jgi:hypothetical protein
VEGYEYGVQYSLKGYEDKIYWFTVESKGAAELIMESFGTDERTKDLKIVKRKVGEWKDA